jgi:hypothetical protein
VVGEGFGGLLGNGLPRGFREPITMGATEMPEAQEQGGMRTTAAAPRENMVGKLLFGKIPDATSSGRERGRRRTRQDQIPSGEAVPDEIADFKRSAPNEENLFLLPDRLRSARAPSSKFDPAV